MARQRNGDGKDVHQVKVMKDKDGNVLTSVMERWRENFEELKHWESTEKKRFTK